MNRARLLALKAFALRAGKVRARQGRLAVGSGRPPFGKKAPRDGDRDGKVFDGTARERPAPVRTPERSARARALHSARARGRPDAAELEALGRLKGVAGLRINSDVRLGTASPEAKQTVATANAAVLRSTLRRERTLYRGLKHDPFEQGGLRARVGDVHAIGGLHSTSRSEAQAAAFGTAAMLRIKAPAGSPALSVNRAIGIASEQEVLLPSNSRFRIDAITHGDAGRIYDVTYLGPAEAPSRPRSPRLNRYMARSAREPRVAPDADRARQTIARVRGASPPEPAFALTAARPKSPAKFAATGSGRTPYLFDMKKGDLPGQTSLLERAGATEARAGKPKSPPGRGSPERLALIKRLHAERKEGRPTKALPDLKARRVRPARGQGSLFGHAAPGKAPRDADGDGTVFDGTAREAAAPRPAPAAGLATPLRRRRAAVARRRESPEERAALAALARGARARASARAERRAGKLAERSGPALAEWRRRQERRIGQAEARYRKKAAKRGVPPERLERAVARGRGRLAGRLAEGESDARAALAHRAGEIRGREARRDVRDAIDRARAARRGERARRLLEGRVGPERATEIRLGRVMDANPTTSRAYRDDPEYRRFIRGVWGLKAIVARAAARRARANADE